MNKLLVICGPTATGKTNLAVHLAKVLKGELISADSRQVYRGLDIGTGKDLEEIGDVPVWGINIIEPEEEFHVKEYINIVHKYLKDIWCRKKLPILVGGTGFYIKALIDGIPTADVPKNYDLRNNLIKKSRENLFKMLSKIDPTKAASLNLSDKKNPRRLMRAIEIATWKFDHKVEKKNNSILKDASVLMIGVSACQEFMQRLISQRTDKMYKKGIVDEIKSLLENGLTWDNQSLNTIGYLEWKDYFNGMENMKDVLMKWKKNEEAYAKRQMTWFKKDSRINWFDVTTRGYKKEVENLVKKWYKEG